MPSIEGLHPSASYTLCSLHCYELRSDEGFKESIHELLDGEACHKDSAADSDMTAAAALLSSTAELLEESNSGYITANPC